MKQPMTTLRAYFPHAFFVIGLMLFAVGSMVFFHTRDVHAATGACPSGTTPLTGYAWAGLGVPNSNPAYASGPGWIHFSGGTASSGNLYGVCENTTTGAISGYAWSSNYGWISFTPTDLLGCPSGNNSCAPSVNLSTGAVTGWARACSAFQTGCSGSLNLNTGGWDGWISLNGITQSATGLWSGYAWGSNDIGWMSVNGATYGVQLNVPLSSSCSVSPAVGDSNTSFTWSAATPTGGSGSYTYSWSGSDGLTGSSQNVSKIYSNVTGPTSAPETGSVIITDSNGNSSGSITCTNSTNGGSGTSITVYPAPTATLTATPGTVVNGQQTNLHWSSTNASSCSGSGFSTANALNGTVLVTPQCVTNGSSTCSVPYSVTCSNPGGSATSNTSVTVIQPNVSITANPERVSSVSPGGTSAISWKATDVSSCTVKGSNSTTPLKTGSADTNGNFTGSATSTGITQQTIFTIACNTKGSPVAAQTIVNILPVFQQF